MRHLTVQNPAYEMLILAQRMSPQQIENDYQNSEGWGNQGLIVNDIPAPFSNDLMSLLQLHARL